MDRPSHPPDVLRDWARMPIPVEESDVNEERRARVVSQMARAIRESKVERERTARRSRLLSVLAVAAVIALFAGGAWRLLGGKRASDPVASVRTSSPGVLVSRGAESRVPALNADQALTGGDVVSTVADARASLRLASGAEVSVAPSTRVTLASVKPGDEQLELGVGEVSVRVPPLGEHGSFRVKTPDARVVVHGTAFVVRVTKQGDGTFTEVDVSEGKVSVERDGSQLFLTPGQSFSSKPAPAAAEPTAPAPAAAPGPATPPAKPAPTPPAKPAAKVAVNDPSALAEQNRLFAAAAAARRSGDDRTSLGHLNQLLTRYPDSPLAPEARVERFRALKRLGQNAEAAREARRYLLDNQSGAARDEARGIALEPSGK